MCQVTHDFMMWPKERRDMIVPWYIVRDILHEHSEVSDHALYDFNVSA